MSNPTQNYYGYDVVGGWYYDGIWYGQIATDLSTTYVTHTSLQNTVNNKAPLTHTHSINDINGLQIILDGKALITHSHAMNDMTGLQTALNTKSNISHTHIVADVIGLQTALDLGTKLLQRVSMQTGTVGTTMASIPDDNTIPQITEGVEFMTLNITPKSASSTLVIEVTTHASSSLVSNIGAALFRDSNSDALAASYISVAVLGSAESMRFSHTTTSGSISPTTFRVRIGGSGVLATTTFNGVGGVGRYGGKIASGITIYEYL